MGAYLSAPVTTKEIHDGESPEFTYGVAAMQGWRTEMEDAHAIVLDLDAETGGGSGSDPPTGFFAVFDGHGGKEVARYAAAHLATAVASADAYKQGDLGGALEAAYLNTDAALASADARAELAALAAPSPRAGGDGDEGGRPGASDGRGTALSVLLGGGGGADGGGGPPGLPPAVIAALAEAGVHVRVARARRARVVAEGEDEDDEEDEEESGSDADHDHDGDDPPSRRGPSARVVAVEVEEEDEIDVDVPPTGGAGPPGAAKRKRAAPRPAGAAASPSSSSGDDDAPPRGGPPPDAPTTDYAPDAPGRYIGPAAGCTAVSALVRGATLAVANAGDSRAVLCRAGGVALPLTTDHKPTDPPELARIVAAGGFVADGRVNGSLNLSRALGDAEHKQSAGLPPSAQAVTAAPDVTTVTLEPGDEFLLLACDGIWDIVTCQEGVDFVRARLAAGDAPAAAAAALCDHCLAPDTAGCGKGCDNMSALVVVLNRWKGNKE